MDSEASSSSSDRPSIGFPLGLTLLIFMLLSMTAFFTCCLHWNKIRSLIRAFRDDDDDDHDDDLPTNIHYLPQKLSPIHMVSKKEQGENVLVSMPGDKGPKFVAIACPCKPYIIEKITVTVQKIPT